MLIQEYQERWVRDFNIIKNIILENIQTNDVNVEHIGSTSVKNLAAKPIIDIDIVCIKPESFQDIKSDLEKIGYHHNGNQGIAGREVFKRVKGKENHQVLDSINHHLYVCPLDSAELKRHIIFRDYLRTNNKERIEYEQLKYEIAKMANQDRKKYAKLKEAMVKDFVESIINKSKPLKSVYH